MEYKYEKLNNGIIMADTRHHSVDLEDLITIASHSNNRICEVGVSFFAFFPINVSSYCTKILEIYLFFLSSEYNHEIGSTYCNI